MSSGAASGGLTSPSQPDGFSAGSPRSTTWLRALFIARLSEYGSVTMLVSIAPVDGT